MLKNNHPRVARRDFLTTAMAAGGAMLLGPTWLNAADGVDPRVAQVMSKTIGIDLHNHVYPPGTEPHLPGQPQRPQEQQQPPELFIAEELKQSGLTAVCASFVLDFANNQKPGDARLNFLHWLDAIDAQLENGHIRRALNLNDLQAAHDHGRPTTTTLSVGIHACHWRYERAVVARAGAASPGLARPRRFAFSARLVGEPLALGAHVGADRANVCDDFGARRFRRAGRERRLGGVFQVQLDGLRDVGPCEFGDQRQGEVDPRRHAGSRDDALVAHDARLDRNGAEGGEEIERSPMRRRAFSPQQPGGAEGQRSGADGGSESAPLSPGR